MDGMRRKGIGALLISVAVVVLTLVSCSDALLTEMNRIATDANKPRTTPVDKSTVTAHEAITFFFTKSMDPASVTVSGNIGTAAPSWTTTTLTNDTLTLNAGAAAAVWTAGAGKTLMLTVTSGSQTVSYSYSFDVFSGVCVSDPANLPNPGAPGAPGTRQAPLDTIQSGINKAKTVYVNAGKGPAEVRVAFGTYSAACKVANASPPQTAVYVADMTANVSLYGGYALDFATRNPGSTHSTIADTDSAGLYSSELNPVRAVNFTDATITTATIFDGFSIQTGNTAGSHCAIYCSNASPAIAHLIISGSSSVEANATLFACGMLLTQSSGHVQYCTVDPGRARKADGTSGISTGIYCRQASAPVIDSNTVSGQIGHDVYGIRIETGCSATVTGNTVSGGSFNAADFGAGRAIFSGGAHPIVTDNTISVIPGYDAFGIEEGTGSGTSNPAQVRRNNFNYSSGNYYYDEAATAITSSNYGTQTVSTAEGTLLLFNATWSNTHP
jgi:hypothetical protein